MNSTLASLGSVVANHLWQSTAFALAAWLLTLALRKNQARVRHAVWVAASVKFLVPFSLLIAAGNLLPHPKQAVAPVVYSAMDVVEEPFTQIALPPTAPVVHVPTLRERVDAVLPVSLGVLWVLGAGVVLVVFAIPWRTVRRTLREAEPAYEGREFEILRRVGSRFAGTRRVRPMALRLSAERMEPGIFGIGIGFGKARPALVWPRELSVRLDDEHIEAVLAHELMHVRRRDNLTAALHMLVEAVFWFHPLVWWMERPMVKEREQACDEAVVAMGGDPDAYAESLLKTVRFCIESPLKCVAGVTGGELKQRVMAIVTGRALLRMSWPKKLLIAAAAVCAVAAPVMLGQARAAQRLAYAMLKSAPAPLRTVAHAMIAEEEMPSMGSLAQVQADGAAPAGEAAQAGGRNYRVWLDQDVRWLISPTEHAAFMALTSDQERDNFIQRFWERKGSEAGVSASAYKAEIYTRFGYANEHFATSDPGWSTDRGRIYIVFGKPDEVKAQTADGIETWTYRHIAGVGDNVALKFATGPGGEPYQLMTQYPAANWADVPRVCCGAFPVGQPDAPAELRGTGMGGGDLFAGGRIDSNSDKTIFYFRLGWAYVLPTGLDFHEGETIVPYNGMPPHGTYGFGEQHVPRRLDATELAVFVEQVMLEDGTDWHADHKQIEAYLARGLGGQPQFPGAARSVGVVPMAQVQERAAQAATMANTKWVFDVVSVKVQDPKERMIMAPNGTAEDFEAKGVTAETLIAYAYDLPWTQGMTVSRDPRYLYHAHSPSLTGDPAWVSSEQFDLIAKADPATVEVWKRLPLHEQQERLREMVLAMLADRFQLKVHTEKREMPAYALVVAKGGPKISPLTGPPPVFNDGSDPSKPYQSPWDGGDLGQIRGHGVTIDGLADELWEKRELGSKKVIDQTGLTGRYDFTLKWTPEGDPEDAGGVSLFTAIQEQLGLKLEPAKVPVNVVVIDHIDRPSAN